MKHYSRLEEETMADGRGFWTCETGTGQQVAQLHDRYMMMMMMIFQAVRIIPSTGVANNS
jgi:hypothetical protein